MRRLAFLALTLMFGCAAVPQYRLQSSALSRLTAQAGPEGNDEPGRAIPVGPITESELGPVFRKIQERAAAGDKEIILSINSPGGSVMAGYFFIKAVEQVKKTSGAHLTCFVDFMGMSFGTAILETICDTRKISKRSILLFHNSSMQVGGTAKDIDNQLAFQITLDKALGEMISARLSISYEDYRKHIDGKDWTMAWEEAIEIGAVDGTVDPKDIPAEYVLPKPVQGLQILIGGD